MAGNDSHNAAWYLAPASRVVELVVLGLALWTAAYHLVLWARWPSHWMVALAAAAAVPSLMVWIRHWPRPGANWDRRAEVLRLGELALLGLLAATYVLVVNRPDSDGEYLRRALVQARVPGQPLLLENVTYDQAVPDILPTQYVCSYEMLVAFAGRLGGVDPIQLYFNVLPAVAAFLTVLIYSLLFRSFGLGPRAVVGATLGALLFLVLDGEGCGPGNFGLVRLWQGKCLLATLALPCALLWGCEFLRVPSWRSGTFFFLLGIGGVGLSATALAQIPAGALAMALAFVVAGGPLRWPACWARCRRAIALGALTVYPIAVALALQTNAGIARQVDSVIAIQFPDVAGRSDLWLLSMFVIGGPRTLVWFALLLLLAPWLALPKEQAGWVAAISVACMLLFSNPIAAPLAQRFLGGIGFRIYYLYPLAFCFGLLVSQIGPLLRSLRMAAWLALLAAAAGATLYGRWIPASMPAGTETVLLTAFAAALLLAVGGLWWQHGRPWEPVLRCVVLSLFGCLFTVQSQRFTFSAANGATFKRPGDYRFSGPVREFDRLTASYLDHRTVLAPREIALAAAVTQLSCRFVVTFDSYTNWSFAVENRLPEARQRALAQTVVGTGNMSPAALAAFRAALAEGVDAVITAPPADFAKVESLLAASGSRWECRVAAAGYRLLLRQTPNRTLHRSASTLARSASEEPAGFHPSLALRRGGTSLSPGRRAWRSVEEARPSPGAQGRATQPRPSPGAQGRATQTGSYFAPNP